MMVVGRHLDSPPVSPPHPHPPAPAMDVTPTAAGTDIWLDAPTSLARRQLSWDSMHMNGTAAVATGQ